MDRNNEKSFFLAQLTVEYSRRIKRGPNPDRRNGSGTFNYNEMIKITQSAGIACAHSKKNDRQPSLAEFAAVLFAVLCRRLPY
ncbi:MAG: hypothetical protein GPOALKHO_000741 [Sodalis sp.]|nr:MAG: hypothetical protein GPOALKHO_000741 [Sodalis sp.]